MPPWLRAAATCPCARSPIARRYLRASARAKRRGENGQSGFAAMPEPSRAHRRRSGKRRCCESPRDRCLCARCPANARMPPLHRTDAAPRAYRTKPTRQAHWPDGYQARAEPWPRRRAGHPTAGMRAPIAPRNRVRSARVGPPVRSTRRPPCGAPKPREPTRGSPTHRRFEVPDGRPRGSSVRPTYGRRASSPPLLWRTNRRRGRLAPHCPSAPKPPRSTTRLRGAENTTS